MEYIVICIMGEEECSEGNARYEKATHQIFDIEGARKYKSTVAKSRNPLIVPANRVNEAIRLNNSYLGVD